MTGGGNSVGQESLYNDSLSIYNVSIVHEWVEIYMGH
jgi:hypothetical protein